MNSRGTLIESLGEINFGNYTSFWLGVIDVGNKNQNEL